MTLSILLFAGGGAGKSHIGPGTSPGPTLVVDTENGISKLRYKDPIYWDYKSAKGYPETSANSLHYVVVESKADMDKIISFLHTEESPWMSFWVDSYTVYAKMVDYMVNGAGSQSKDARQDYKKLLRELEPQIITLNHIGSRADRKLEVIGYTAWQQGEKVTPAITGGISQTLDHSCDLVGHVSITFDNGKIGQVLHIMPTKGIMAKAPGEFYEKYGETIVNPNITTLNEEMKHVK